MIRKSKIAHTRGVAGWSSPQSYFAELSKPERTVRLSHLSVKGSLATLPILNRKGIYYPLAATTRNIALATVIKGCLAYVDFFDDVTPVMRNLPLYKEYPLVTFIYKNGPEIVTLISSITGDSALCQLLAELLTRRPTSLLKLLNWDNHPHHLPDDSYDRGHVPLEQLKMSEALLIAAELGACCKGSCTSER